MDRIKIGKNRVREKRRYHVNRVDPVKENRTGFTG